MRDASYETSIRHFSLSRFAEQIHHKKVMKLLLQFVYGAVLAKIDDERRLFVAYLLGDV
jgi:hypothetical protein